MTSPAIPAILYEDDSVVAADKPAGVVVHPTYKNTFGTLLDLLRARDPLVRFSLVGRLDKETSGVVIAAKSAAIHAAMQRAWPDAEKDYLAIVCGHVRESHGEIVLPLGPDPADRRRRIVTLAGAASTTRFERLDYSASSGLSLLRCRLVTGRRHQIRVHLAALGWPIAGDAVYGTGASPPLPYRHALHAWRIAFMHPSSGAVVAVEAPVPADLRAFLAVCKLRLI